MRYYTQNTASFEMVAMAARCVSPDKARGLEILDEANGGRAHDTEIPGVLIFKLVDMFPHNYEGTKRI